MIAKPYEIVYVNGGEIYKSPTPYDLNTQYMPNPNGDPIFPLMKATGKQYVFTTEFKKYFSGGEGASLDGIDLCPDVTLWVALGSIESSDRTNFDIAFAIDSSEQLSAISDYYNLPYPITPEVADIIDNNPQTIEYWNVNGRSIVFGAIKFIDSVPAIFKVYTYPKLFGEWNASRYCISYYDGGKPWEAGAIYEKLTGGIVTDGVRTVGRGNFMQAQKSVTVREDGRRLQYTTYFNGIIDPLIQWRANEFDENNNKINTRYFESSVQIRRHVGGLNSGNDLSSYNLSPAVSLWAGRSWWETGPEEEIFFVVDGGSSQLQAVADYYNLTNPCNIEISQILDATPNLYRATNRFPYVLASIQFVDNIPTKLLLHTFVRQTEFQDQIELPF